MNKSVPISTQWLLEASDSTNKEIINSVYLIYCEKTQSKGTGFLITNGVIVTNWHVVKECNASEVVAISSTGEKIIFSDSKYDINRDLAILTPKTKINEGLELKEEIMKTETKVITWGHPLAYNGPSPILSVGYIAGFKEHKENRSSSVVKRYVVNGAFNPGNSGGPLMNEDGDKVIGIVVAKHAPITQFLKSALEALESNNSGVVFSATDDTGARRNFVESQIVAKLLEHQMRLTQVMLGEAIVTNELIACLKENGIEDV